MQKPVLFATSAFLALFASHAWAGVKGTVSVGKAPAEAAIDMASDPKCKSLNAKPMTDDFTVAGGKVANVFVYVKNAPKGEYKAPAEKVTLDQKGCMYHPKMMGIMVGQEFEIVNSDPTLHNVHAYAKPGEFNQAMPKQGQKITKKFKKQQVPVEIKCDVHKWMHADIGVVEHPFFAITDASGAFDIGTALPDGDYEVEAVHGMLGKATGKVKVAGGNGSVDITLPGK